MPTLQQEHNNAVQRCQQAIDLLGDSNEFFFARLSVNQSIYSTDIHNCVINGSFIFLYETLESFLESAFLCYLLGDVGLNGTAVTRYANPPTEDHAIKMIRGPLRYPDFTDREKIIKLAECFFSNGGPFVFLNGINQDMEDMKKIRNAISHISIESQEKFTNLVRAKLGYYPLNTTTASFLNTYIPNVLPQKTFFAHYRDVILSAIAAISNP